MSLRLGLSGGLVPRDPDAITPALAARLADLGVTAVVLHLQPPPDEVAAGIGPRVRRVLGDAGVGVVQATGYNPRMTAEDGAVRRSELDRLARAFDAAASLGAEMVISGASSLHPTEFYGPDPRNHLPETRARLVDSLRTAARYAEDSGVVLAIECHVLTPMDSPQRIREVLDEVGSPWVKANFDPVNLLGTVPQVYDSGAEMRRMWDVVGGHYAPCCHVKDVAVGTALVVHIDEVPPGHGLLDTDVLLELCRTRLPEGAALVVEHLPADLAEPALEWVRRRAELAGLSLATPQPV